VPVVELFKIRVSVLGTYRHRQEYGKNDESTRSHALRLAFRPQPVSTPEAGYPRGNAYRTIFDVWCRDPFPFLAER
jgi:hypothetical protein